MKRRELTSAIKDEFDPAKLTYPCMGFYKYDGVRAGHLHGYFHGRSLDPFANKALNAKFADEIYHGLDGEITLAGALTDTAIRAMIAAGTVVGDAKSSLCSLTTGLTNRKDLKKGETELPSNVVWNLFDFLHEEVVELTYLERYQALVAYVETAKPAHVRVAPFEWIHTEEEALAWVAKCLALKLEGAIFRNPRAKHKSGRATATAGDFWRYKPKSDKDAVVIGFEAAMANNNEATINSRGRTERSAHKENKVAKATIGKFIVYMIDTDTVETIGAGTMDHKEREECFANPGLIVGHPCKVQSLDTGTKTSLRQAFYKERRSWADLEKLTPEQAARVTELLEEHAR